MTLKTLNCEITQLPRRLETDGSADFIRKRLLQQIIYIGKDGACPVPCLTMDEGLKKALLRARLQRHIRLGFEDIRDRLSLEKKGLDDLRQKTSIDQNIRISRLLLFSNDCAPRLYRHIECLLADQSPRLLGCMVNIDAKTLGKLFAGPASEIKVILIEHKDAVVDILSALSKDLPNVQPPS